MKIRLAPLFVIVLTIALALSACGMSDAAPSNGSEMPAEGGVDEINPPGETNPESMDDPQVETETETPFMTTEPISPVEQVELAEKYMVGEVIQLPDRLIVLSGAEYMDGMLTTEFIIGNSSPDFINITFYNDFQGFSADGSPLEMDSFDECSYNLLGPLAPGEKMTGKICWYDAAEGSWIHYKPILGNYGPVIWEVGSSTMMEQASTPELEALTFQGVPVPLGAAAETTGQRVTLNSVSAESGMLVANLTITNLSEDDADLHSHMNFYARKLDGTPIRLEYLFCENLFDRNIEPNETIEGNVCFKNEASEFYLYYEADYLHSEYVLWQVNL